MCASPRVSVWKACTPHGITLSRHNCSSSSSSIGCQKPISFPNLPLKVRNMCVLVIVSSPCLPSLQVVRLLRVGRLEDLSELVVTIAGPLYRGWGNAHALEEIWSLVASSVSKHQP